MFYLIIPLSSSIRSYIAVLHYKKPNTHNAVGFYVLAGAAHTCLERSSTVTMLCVEIHRSLCYDMVNVLV